MKTIALAFALLGITNAQRCYQGQQNASIPVQGSPMDCLFGASSCILTYDEDTNLITRACQISNCTLKCVLSVKPVCTRADSADSVPSFTTYCCCYTDGCNGDPKTNPSKAASETNLAGSIAHRIENFYDQDAVSAERTFIRRVVHHVYQHIDRENMDNG